MKIANEKFGAGLIGAVFIGIIVVFVLTDPVAQDLEYHGLADVKGWACLPNALNVLSNIPFILIGITGLMAIYKPGKQPLNIINSNRLSYVCLFLGSILVGIGSSYYHISPSNETLVWDRIPMAIAFMALYSIVISEFASDKVGKILLFPLIVIGIGSVVYWWLTEADGVGDIRFYAAVQFLPVLTIPIILIFFKSKFTLDNGYWVLLLSYVGAKVFEVFDHQLHDIFGVVSGHSIKHVLPAIGLYYLLVTYKKRVSTSQTVQEMCLKR